MAKFALRGWLFVLLCAVSFVLANPSPKKGGGGDSGDSSGGGSSGSDGSSGSSGGSGSSSSGRAHAQVTGDKWPYRWPGSYYNGSMIFEVSIESWPGCSEGTRKGMRVTMDGILMLGSGNATGTFDAADPNFVLMAWDAGKIPANNWTDGIQWRNGGPGATRYYSTDVKLLLSRWVDIWQPFGSSEQSYDLGWQVDSRHTGANDSNTFAINGTNSGGAATYNPQDNSQDNYMQMTTLLCNNQTTVDTLSMQPWPYASAVKDWPTTQNTTFSGSFSDSEASITWSGNYWGGFNSIDYGVPSTKSGYPQGYFKVAFDGKLDSSQSDQLVARTDDLEGYYQSAGDPTWIKKYDRSMNEPQVDYVYTNKAARLPMSGTLWLLLASMTAIAIML